MLVLFEFSGAVRDACATAGRDAISCDLRASETPGLHYQGDVRDIVPLRKWLIVYAVGPCCYQHLTRAH